MKKLLLQISVFFSVSLLFAILGCSGQGDKVNVEADVAAIQALVQAWGAAAEAGDVAGMLAKYSDNIVQMPPDAPANRGKQAVEEYYRRGFELFSVEVTWPVEGTEEIIVADGWAFHVSEYIQWFTPKAGGEKNEVRGKIIEILQQQPNGSWKFAREIWNRNSPPDKD